MIGPIQDVQLRMASIQARFGVTAPVPAATQANNGGAPVDFANALERALGTSPLTGSPTSIAGPDARSGSIAGEAVVSAARQYLGVPYVWGGTDPATGLDCSGFVQRTFRDVGIELPRVSADQARSGRPVASLAEARPGDLLAFDWSAERPGIDHIGIYIGNNKMIEAPRRGSVVSIREIPKPPAAIRRILPDSAPASDVQPLTGLPFAGLFEAAAARHGVSPRLLVEVARAESSFDPTAVSPAGARGLMQLMPATAASLGVDAMDPAQAVDGAARLLSSHLRQFGTVPLALAAYNAGPGAVTRHGGIPPFAETQRYVARITRALEAA